MEGADGLLRRYRRRSSQFGSRRAYTDASQGLVGVDDAGNALRPLTAGEQEAFARAALTAADMVVRATVDLRVEARLLNHLRT